MQIISTGNTSYVLTGPDGTIAGSLLYNNLDCGNGLLQCGPVYMIQNNEPGAWTIAENMAAAPAAVCRVGIAGIIGIQTGSGSYVFKKPAGWKPRFALLNGENEELLAVLPVLNWENRTFDFMLQLNGDYKHLLDSFLILQAIHCAVCSMAMLNGRMVPAVVAGSLQHC